MVRTQKLDNTHQAIDALNRRIQGEFRGTNESRVFDAHLSSQGNGQFNREIGQKFAA